MRLPPDFADLLTCLNEAEAEYMLVGGYAVNVYGFSRATEDLDIWVRPSPENAIKVAGDDQVRSATRPLDFGPVRDCRVAADWVSIRAASLAVDLLTSIQGIDFEDAWPLSVVRDCGGLEARFIGVRELIRSKRAAGRPKDGVDADELERLVARR